MRTVLYTAVGGFVAMMLGALLASEFLAAVGALVLVVAVAVIPGEIAKARGHHNALAIRVLGIAGILTLGILWLVALIWALTEPRTAR